MQILINDDKTPVLKLKPTDFRAMELAQAIALNVGKVFGDECATQLAEGLGGFVTSCRARIADAEAAAARAKKAKTEAPAKPDKGAKADG